MAGLISLLHFFNAKTKVISSFTSSESTQSLNACVRSWQMNSELLSKSQIWLNDSHFKLWPTPTQDASLGALQFNFGNTAPPNSSSAALIWWLKSGKLGWAFSLSSSSSTSSLSSALHSLGKISEPSDCKIISEFYFITQIGNISWNHTN